MKTKLKTYGRAAITAVAMLAAGLTGGSPAVGLAVAGDAMPVAEQNALVQKYCVVCHDDAKMIGWLSLERFDAAHADPGMAAMMASKLKTGAMGAAGIKPLPDRMTQDALLSALSTEGAGAATWFVMHTEDATTHAPVLTASIVRASSAAKGDDANLYRMKLTCNTVSHEGDAQVAWAPADIQSTGAMHVAVEGMAPAIYTIERGEGAARLSEAKDAGIPKFAMPAPTQTLTVSHVFPGETAVFSFDGLPPAARQLFSACFTGSRLPLATAAGQIPKDLQASSGR